MPGPTPRPFPSSAVGHRNRPLPSWLLAPPPIQLLNSSEGGTSGTGITNLNSGGVSGDAYSSTTASTSCTITFDNAHAAHGGLSVKSLLGITAGEAYVRWDLVNSYTTIWTRQYLYFAANPGSGTIVQKTASAGSNAGIVSVTTTGHIALLDSSGTTQATSTNVIPLNAWFRLECKHVGDPANGSIEAKIFTSMDSGTPLEILNTPTNINTTGLINQIRMGHTGTGIASVTFWIDDLGVSSVAYLGPVMSVTPTTIRRSSPTARIGVARRGKFFPTPVPATVVPPVTPVYVGPQIGARHPAAASARLARGRFFLVHQSPPPSVGPQIGARRPTGATLRPARGRFQALPSMAPPAIPSRLNGRWWRPFISRRGQIFPVPVPVVVVTQTGPLVPRITRPAIHWPNLIRRRGQVLPVVPAPVVVTQTGPLVPRPVRLAIHWPGTIRRGQIFRAPTLPAAVPAKVSRQATRWPGIVRRGRISIAPVAAVVPPISATRPAIHWPTLIRRGQAFRVPPAITTTPQVTTHRTAQWRAPIRRGQIFPVPVPVVVAAQTGPLVPRPVRLTIHWPTLIRRGQVFRVPPVLVVVPTGPVVPKTQRLAIHWPGPVRHGKLFFIPSSSQAAPTTTPVAPRMIQQHRQTRVLARRGRISPVPPGQPGRVPSPIRPSASVGARGARPGTMPRGRRWITPTAPTAGFPGSIGPARRTLAVRPARGRFLATPPPRVVVPNPLYVHRIMRARSRFWHFARRGALQFTRLTGALGFPAEFITASSGLDMIGTDSGPTLVTTAITGSAEFVGTDLGVTFVDGDTGIEFRGGPQ